MDNGPRGQLLGISIELFIAPPSAQRQVDCLVQLSGSCFYYLPISYGYTRENIKVLEGSWINLN